MLRGLTSGLLDLSPASTMQTPCLLIGHTFHSWLPILPQLGYLPKLIMLQSLARSALIAAFCPNTPICLPQEGVNRLSTLPAISTLFLDAPFSKSIFDLCERFHVEFIYGTQQCRTTPCGWGSKHFRVQHSHVSGVTEKQGQVTLLFWRPRAVIRGPCVLPRHHHRDVSTILGFNAFTRSYGAKPPDLFVIPASARNLALPLKTPVYHGGGLLPADVSLRTKVMTPHRFAPTNHWAIRSLANSELLLALDFTETMAKSDHQRALIAVSANIIPGKILRAGYLIIRGAMTFQVIAGQRGG
jgi:hypothetical protein